MFELIRMSFKVIGDGLRKFFGPHEVYLSESEIVEDMITRMTDDDVRLWLLVRERDLISGHSGIGRTIRNTYRLWDESNPYVCLSDVTHGNFPDQMSMRIIHTIWQQAIVEATKRGIELPTEDQIAEAEKYVRGS